MTPLVCRISLPSQYIKTYTTFSVNNDDGALAMTIASSTFSPKKGRALITLFILNYNTARL
jgi:hypothetical protein